MSIWGNERPQIHPLVERSTLDCWWVEDCLEICQETWRLGQPFRPACRIVAGIELWEVWAGAEDGCCLCVGIEAYSRRCCFPTSCLGPKLSASCYANTDEVWLFLIICYVMGSYRSYRQSWNPSGKPNVNVPWPQPRSSTPGSTRRCVSRETPCSSRCPSWKRR